MSNRGSEIYYGKGLLQVAGILLFGSFFTAIFPENTLELLLLMSFFLIVIGYLGIARLGICRDWLAVKAKILTIKEDWIEEKALYNSIKHYYPLIEYEYRVQDAVYRSDVVALDLKNIWVPEVDAWGTPITSDKKFWSNWKQGSEITVYVDTDNAERSVVDKNISPRVRRIYYILVFSGMVLMAFYFNIKL